MKQMGGFDDERVRDEYLGAVEARRQMEMEQVGAGWAVVRGVLLEWWRAAMEALRQVVEALAAIGEAALEAIGAVWESIVGAGVERRGRYKGPPAHCNCRCLPVERVDPVRAGRIRWWTRK